jgi:hypothetical protein
MHVSGIIDLVREKDELGQWQTKFLKKDLAMLLYCLQ